MTHEEKQLLLTELCARLPYGVICTDLRHGDSKITEVDIEDGLVYCFDFDEYIKVEDCHLYLRPMSSMTLVERIELKAITKGVIQIVGLEGIVVTTDKGFDYLNSIHIDYRGLIEKRLALEAPEGMYKL